MIGWPAIQKWIATTVHRRTVRAIQPHVRGKLLDVGCWNGIVASQLQGVQATGIDVVDPPSPVIPVTRFDGKTIPFPDQSFDTVLCSFVLHHADHPNELFAELVRVGRRLVIVEDSIERPWNRLSVIKLHDIMVKTDNMPYHPGGFRKIEQWRSLFSGYPIREVAFRRMHSVHPCWPGLRHFLFVLDTKESQ